MIQTIIIRPTLAVNGLIILEGEYTDQKTGVSFYLTTTGEVMDKQKLAMETTTQNGSVISIPLQKRRDEVFDPNRTSLPISFDESIADDKTNPEHAKHYKLRRVVEFYMLHPICTPFYGTNPNLISPVFSVENSAKRIRETVKMIDFKNAVANRVKSMSLMQKIAVACWAGLNPKKIKSHSDLYAELLDFSTGALMIGEQTHKGKNVSMSQYFMEVYKADDPSIEMLVNVRKAINYGIIETREGNFYVGGSFAGTSEEAVMDYMRLNTDIYEGSVLKGVEKKGTLGIEDDMKVSEPIKEEKPNLIQKAEKPTVQDYTAERNSLIERAKELDIASPHVYKDLDKLKLKISAAEKELENA